MLQNSILQTEHHRSQIQFECVLYILNLLQLSQVETDNVDLQTISRNDKNLIHNLHVRIRELELVENNLKTQLGIVEEEENEMIQKIMMLTDRVDELERLLRKTTKAKDAPQSLDEPVEKSSVSKSLESENSVENSSTPNAELEQLARKKEELERNAETSKKQIKKLEREVSKLKTELEVHSLVFDTKNKETQTVESKNVVEEVEKLRKEKEGLREENHQVARDLETLKVEVDRQSAEIRRLTDGLDSKERDANAETKHVKSKLNLLKAHVEDLERKSHITKKVKFQTKASI